VNKDYQNNKGQKSDLVICRIFSHSFGCCSHTQSVVPGLFRSGKRKFQGANGRKKAVNRCRQI